MEQARAHTGLFPSAQKALPSVAWRAQSWLPEYPRGEADVLTSSRHACNPFLSLGSGPALQSTAFRLSPPNWRHPALRLRRQGNSVRHPVEGFQEAALLRVNICSALGLGQSITARGPSHSDHRTPISGTHSHRLGEPHLTLAVVCCPPSFIPRLETGPGREQVRMP